MSHPDSNSPQSPPPDSWHRRTLEHKSALFAVITTLAISVGGLVELEGRQGQRRQRPAERQMVPGVPPRLDGERHDRHLRPRQGDGERDPDPVV